jgi:hypothetical protein
MMSEFYQNNWVAEPTSQNRNNAPRRRPNENFLIITIPPSPSGRRLSHLFSWRADATIMAAAGLMLAFNRSASAP